jgi:hypothetical protein
MGYEKVLCAVSNSLSIASTCCACSRPQQPRMLQEATLPCAMPSLSLSPLPPAPPPRRTT